MTCLEEALLDDTAVTTLWQSIITANRCPLKHIRPQDSSSASCDNQMKYLSQKNQEVPVGNLAVHPVVLPDLGHTVKALLDLHLHSL